MMQDLENRFQSIRALDGGECLTIIWDDLSLSTGVYVGGAHWSRLSEAILVSTCGVCCRWEI